MHACSFVLDRNDFERARVTKFMNFPVIERNFEGKSMATLDCAHARSFVAGGRAEFFFLEVEMCRHFERPCFRALFD